MEYAELTRKSSTKYKRRMQYIPPKIDHGHQIIKMMLIKAKVSKNTISMSEDGTVRGDITYGTEIEVNTLVTKEILGRTFYCCNEPGGDTFFYIREDCLKVGTWRSDMRAPRVNIINDDDPAASAAGLAALERGNQESVSQSLGSVFELYANSFFRVLHNTAFVIANYGDGHNNELDFVVFERRIGRIIIYSAKMNPRAFKRCRDLEMWQNLRESIFESEDYSMQIGSPGEYGTFYESPEIRVIHPGSFSMDRKEFADKFAPGWRELPQTKKVSK